VDIVYLANCVLPSRSANTIQITKMCEAFAREGHEVTLLVPAHPDAEEDVEDVYDFYDVDPAFEIRKLPRPSLSSLGTLVVNYRMGREAARLEPDVVYGRTVVGCYFAARSGVRTVFETHAPVRESRFGRVLDVFFRRLIRQSSFDYLVVISDALRSYYREHYSSLGNILVARDAADAVDESTEPAALGSGDRLQVGYVGHLYQGRGMDLIADMARQFPAMDFHVIGGDPEDVDRWEDRLSDLETVTLYGFLPPGELDQYRLAFDVQLAPYQRNLKTNAGHNTVQWMSPLKIFEYMAAGRAIVASDLPAIREILVDGETALLCPPADRDAWADALGRLAENPQLRSDLGHRARAEFLANYTYRQRARLVLRERERTHPSHWQAADSPRTG
jgi:glycosyltransferase involved in cell wall biosynthesis